MTKEELLQKIDEKVYENENGEVTAEAVNEVLKDIVGYVPQDVTPPTPIFDEHAMFEYRGSWIDEDEYAERTGITLEVFDDIFANKTRLVLLFRENSSGGTYITCHVCNAIEEQGERTVILRDIYDENEWTIIHYDHSFFTKQKALPVCYEVIELTNDEVRGETPIEGDRMREISHASQVRLLGWTYNVICPNQDVLDAINAYGITNIYKVFACQIGYYNGNFDTLKAIVQYTKDGEEYLKQIEI